MDQKKDNSNKSITNQNPEDIKDGKLITDIEREESDASLDSNVDRTDIQIDHHHEPWYRTKKFIISSVIISILLIIFLIPVTRYKILGIFIKENFKLLIIDHQTKLPVAGAIISINGISNKTDSSGFVVINSHIGTNKISVSRKYYSNIDQNIFIPWHQKGYEKLSITATGRQVSMTIVDKITKTAINHLTVTSDGLSAQTNSLGIATLVVSPEKLVVKVVISGTGYKTQTTEISTDSSKTNNLEIIPSSYVYYLSNISGTIDVVKSLVDGSNQKTVLAGNKSEVIYDTSLTPSNDWKYLALSANRNNTKPCLTIIQSSDDSSYIIDQTNGTYSIYGWDTNNNLIYSVENTNLPSGSTGKFTLKSYISSTNKTITLDASSAQANSGNYGSEGYTSVYVLPNDSIVYSKNWGGDLASFTGLQMTINSINDNGTGKKTISTYDQASYQSVINSHLNAPSGIIFWLSKSGSHTPDYYQYSNGQFTDITDNQNLANLNSSPTIYPISPDASKIIYSNNINGHSAIYVSGLAGNNPKQVALLGNTFKVYGWLTNNYIILNNNSNEFYIMPVTGVANQKDLIKITNHL